MIVLAAALCAGAATGAFAAILVPPPARLAGRLAPHLGAAASRLRISLPGVASAPERLRLRKILGPRIGRLPLQRRLDESGLWPGTTPSERVARYRVRVTAVSVGVGMAAGVLGATLGADGAATLAMSAAGAVSGVSLTRGYVDRSVRSRRRTMRLELPTVCQLLAVRTRSGGGVVAACGQLVRSAGGEVVAEIDQALRLHRGGAPVEVAFDKIAGRTPERFASRLYRLLARAERRGHDVATGLLALADQLRRDAREEMRREATRRRATMLLPLIGLLGPILVLFVAAPLPWIVLRTL